MNYFNNYFDIFLILFYSQVDYWEFADNSETDETFVENNIVDYDDELPHAIVSSEMVKRLTFHIINIVHFPYYVFRMLANSDSFIIECYNRKEKNNSQEALPLQK